MGTRHVISSFKKLSLKMGIIADRTEVRKAQSQTEDNTHTQTRVTYQGGDYSCNLIFRISLPLKMWSVDWQLQHLLGAC